MLKKTYLYDVMISVGLVSLGTGLFFVYGPGITMIIMGGISIIMGAIGYRNN